MNDTIFPILKTERLTLRSLSLDDQKDIFSLRSDEEINKFLDRQPCNTIEDAIRFINNVNDNQKNNQSFYWVITLTETNTFMGTICLFDFIIVQKSCEIGYELLTKFQGQGIMNEAAEAVVNYAFENFQIKTINAFSHVENKSSIRLLNKLGFKKSEENKNENAHLNLYSISK